MKALLIQPPHYYSGVSRGPSIFSLGLGYIARALIDAGVDVEVFDIWAHQYSNSEVVKILRRKKFNFVGISALSTQYKYVKWLIGEIRKVSKAPIYMGGALSTINYEVVLKKTATDVCIIGEGDETIVEVVKNPKKLSSINGIAFKSRKKIIVTPQRERIKELGEIGFPAWDLFPMDKYLEGCKLFHPKYPDLITMSVILGRGCPYNCHFCSRVFKTVNLRPIDNVIDEIKELKKKFAIKAIHFCDELAVISEGRMLELCEKIKGVDIKWQCQGRINLVNVALLKKMKEAGCISVGYGVESGSQKILDNMNKQINAKDSLRLIKETIKVGISPNIQMIYGYPGESRETIKETLEFLKKIPWRCNLSVLTALPGTKIYQDALERGYIKDEEKYLEKLEGGFTADQKYDSFINFTEFSDEEFFTLKVLTEKIMRKNFVIAALKKPIFFMNFYMPRIMNTLKYSGFGKFFKRVISETSGAK